MTAPAPVLVADALPVEATGSVLPDDVARCAGVGSDAEGWREGCDDGIRRLAPAHDPRRTVHMAPPPIIAFWCAFHLAP